MRLIYKFKKKLGKGDLREVLKGGSIALIYRLVTMAISYALMILIARTLGKEGVGVYNICLALLGILIMIGSLGFNTSVIRYVSQYNAKGWVKSIQALYTTMLKLTSPVALALAVSLFLAAPWMATEFYHDENLIIPFRITACILPFGVLATVNVEFIRGLKKVHVSELFRNLSLQAINFIGLLALWKWGLSPEDPVLFYGLGFAISAAITWWYIYRWVYKAPHSLAPSPGEPPFHIGSHLWVSLPMILTSFVQLINGKVDTLMLGIFESTGVVGVFSVALKLSIITNFVISALKTIAMPKISELFWEGKMPELNALIQSTTRIIFFFSLPVSILLILFPKTILGLVNPEFESGALTLQIFAVTQLANAVSGMVAVFLNMTGNQAYFTKLVTVATVLNIVLNYALIPVLGMEGAALSTMISILLWNIVGARYIYVKFGIATFYNPFKSKPRKPPGS